MKKTNSNKVGYTLIPIINTSYFTQTWDQTICISVAKKSNILMNGLVWSWIINFYWIGKYLIFIKKKY